MKRTHLLAMVIVPCIALWAAAATAHTYAEVDAVCPICGKQFKAKLTSSEFRMDKRLDLKPVGALVAPMPVGVCPVCGFVLYWDELSEADLSKLKDYVKTDEYKGLVKSREPYFRIAKMKELLGVDAFDLAFTYIEASWEDEDNPALYAADVAASLAYLDKVLQAMTERGDGWITANLLKIELQRRVGQFAGALASLNAAKAMPEFQKGFIADVIAFESTLIADKDSKPHTMNEAGEAAEKTRAAKDADTAKVEGAAKDTGSTKDAAPAKTDPAKNADPAAAAAH